MRFLSQYVFSALQFASQVANPISTKLIHWILEYMSFLIPSERLYESDTLIAFHHPRPSYALHILLLPKNEIGSLAEFDPKNNPLFLISLFEATKDLVSKFQLEDTGYRLVTNGGKYQDIPYLHFHLISDSVAD